MVEYENLISKKLWLLQFSFAISVGELSTFSQNCPIHVHNMLDKDI